MTPEDRLKNVRESQNYFSGKISELARYIGFGLVAVSFSLLSSDSLFAKALAAKATSDLSWSGLLGCATVLCDYLHLLMGWWASSQAASNVSGDYQLAGIGKAFRFLQDRVFFYLKQVLPLAGVVFLLVALSKSLTVPEPFARSAAGSPSGEPTVAPSRGTGPRADSSDPT